MFYHYRDLLFSLLGYLNIGYFPNDNIFQLSKSGERAKLALHAATSKYKQLIVDDCLYDAKHAFTAMIILSRNTPELFAIETKRDACIP
jgi:hypothetical protein